MNPLTVTLLVNGPLGGQHRAVLASVPDRWRAVPRGGDVALVDASAAGWTDRLVEALRTGARGALVVDAGADDGPDDVRAAARTARQRGAVVLVDLPCVATRAWRQAETDWRRDAARAVLLDSTVATAGRLDHALLQQLALVRAVVGRSDQLGAVHRSAAAYQIAGRAGAVRVSLSGTDAAQAGLTVDLVGAGTRRQARFTTTGLAAPARISIFDRAGARTAPLVYESSHRAAWLALHAAVTAPGEPHPGRDLDVLAEDIAQVHALLGHRSATP